MIDLIGLLIGLCILVEILEYTFIQALIIYAFMWVFIGILTYTVAYAIHNAKLPTRYAEEIERLTNEGIKKEVQKEIH